METTLPFVGVLLAQLVILSLAYAKLRSDDRRRWHERRMGVYARFLSRTGEVVAYADVFGPKRMSGVRPLDLKAELRGLIADKVMIDLLAGTSVRDRADSLMHQIQRFVSENDEINRTQYLVGIEEARTALLHEVRDELAVRS